VLARPDGKVAYVSCSKAKQIAVIDLTQWNVVAKIDAGKGVDGLAWAAPAGNKGLHNMHQDMIRKQVPGQ
jgi:hypothetical protein